MLRPLLLLAGIFVCFLLTSSPAIAQVSEFEAKGEWDELSRDVIPKIIERNGDIGSFIREVGKVDCRIDWKLSSSTMLRPLLSAFRYGWEDINGDGVLSADEIDVRVVKSPGQGLAEPMEEVRKGLVAMTLMSAGNLFPLNHVTTVRRGSDYEMTLTAADAGLRKQMRYESIKLTVSDDYRVTRAVITAQDDSRSVVNATYRDMAGKWYPIGERKETKSKDGSLVREDKSITYTIRDGIPLPQRVALTQIIFTTEGPLTFENVFTFSDWTMVKRPVPLPMPKPKSNVPDVPGGGQAPEGGAEEAGGVFEHMGGGEDVGGGTARPNPEKELAAKLIEKLRKEYFTFEGRYPGVTYDAKFELTDKDGAVVTPVKLGRGGFKAEFRRGQAEAWCTRAVRPLDVFREKIIYSAMGLDPGIVEPQNYTARPEGDGHLLTGHDPENGKLVERTRLTADGTLVETEEWYYQGEKCQFMFRHRYVSAGSGGTKFLKSVKSQMFDGETAAPIKEFETGFTYTKTKDRIFLLRLKMSRGAESATFTCKEVDFGGEPPAVETVPGTEELADQLIEKISQRYYTWMEQKGERKVKATYHVKDEQGTKVGSILVEGIHVDVDHRDAFPTKYLGVGVSAIEGMKWFFQDPLHSVTRKETLDYTAKREGAFFFLSARKVATVVDTIKLDQDMQILGRREWQEGDDLCAQYRYETRREGEHLLFDKVQVGFCPKGSNSAMFSYRLAFRYGQREGVTFLTGLDVSLGATKISVELANLVME